MNHNSFPSGEQAPDQQNGGDVAEFPSFEEHMQNMNHNSIEATKSSMKNKKAESAAYLSPELEDLGNKIKEGQKLDTEDITGTMAATYGGVFARHEEKMKNFLAESGFNKGSDFDVKLPGTLISTNGKEERTPLSISFFNGEDYTRVNFLEEDGGNISATSSTGKKEEGLDVGYDGPVSVDYSPDNYKSELFD